MAKYPSAIYLRNEEMKLFKLIRLRRTAWLRPGRNAGNASPDVALRNGEDALAKLKAKPGQKVPRACPWGSKWALVFLGLSLLTAPAFSQCTPSSANLLVSGDDNSYIWINGHVVSPSPVTYCGGVACVPTPIPVPTTVFDQGQSVLVAVETDNTNPNQTFGAWSLEINCAGGFDWVISSESYATIPFYWDPNGGMAATCAGAAPPQPDGAAVSWFGFAYNPASDPFTMTAAPVTGAVY